jgi:hypothetical protein
MPITQQLLPPLASAGQVEQSESVLQELGHMPCETPPEEEEEDEDPELPFPEEDPLIDPLLDPLSDPPAPVSTPPSSVVAPGPGGPRP